MPADVFLEGGDVLRVGRTLFVGLSSRTNEVGIEALRTVVQPFGYAVVPVRVPGCLHLKTACCAVDAETLLVNRAWVDIMAFTGLRLIEVPADEPWGANVLRLPDRILVSSSYPRTADLVKDLGHSVVPVAVSELHKAEAGITCMSLVFESGPQVQVSAPAHP